MLVESILLAVAAGVLGLVFTSWTMKLLTLVAHETVPRMNSIRLDGKILFFNVAISLLTAIVFGVIPALRSSKTDLQETLKVSSSTTTDVQGKRLGGSLVVAEVAFSVALLVGAGLMLKSVVLLMRSDNGFDAN